MWVKALKSFGGKVSMGQGQEMELEENDTLQDLLEAGYVTKIMVNGQEPSEPDKAQEETTENQNSNAEDSTDQSADEAELEEMSAADLKKLAKEMGVSTAGTKKEIIQRIAEIEVEIGTEAEGDACEDQ